MQQFLSTVCSEICLITFKMSCLVEIILANIPGNIFIYIFFFIYHINKTVTFKKILGGIRDQNKCPRQ